MASFNLSALYSLKDNVCFPSLGRRQPIPAHLASANATNPSVIGLGVVKGACRMLHMVHGIGYDADGVTLHMMGSSGPHVLGTHNGTWHDKHRSYLTAMLAIAEVLVRHRTHQDAACAEFATRWQTLLAALTHDRGGPPPYSAQALASAANNQVVTDAMMAATDALYHAIKALAPIFIDSADPQPRAINAGALDDIVYGSASPPPSSPQPLPLIAPTTGTVATLQRLLRRGGTALLVGPTGVGKTYAVKQAVLAEGARLVIVKGRPDLDDRQLYGGIYPTADLVFPSEVGTPVSSSNAWRSLQRLLVRVGLPRMRFHDLRHSCATFLALQGVHMRTAMEILGHSTIATTAEIYMSVLDESKQHAAAQMGALFPHKDTA